MGINTTIYNVQLRVTKKTNPTALATATAATLAAAVTGAC